MDGMRKEKQPQPMRFELRLPAELGVAIDDWRRQQPDLPSRAEAVRRLLELGLAAPAPKPSRKRGDA